MNKDYLKIFDSIDNLRRQEIDIIFKMIPEFYVNQDERIIEGDPL